jgi:hypothetical protein
MSPGEVHVNRPFQDLGIDSLMAVAARNRHLRRHPANRIPILTGAKLVGETHPGPLRPGGSGQGLSRAAGAERPRMCLAY